LAQHPIAQWSHEVEGVLGPAGDGESEAPELAGYEAPTVLARVIGELDVLQADDTIHQGGIGHERPQGIRSDVETTRRLEMHQLHQLLPTQSTYRVRLRASSSCRSIASSINRSINCEYGTPDAAHNRGYTLMRVKPGMVLISFTNNLPDSRSRKK